MKKWLIASTLCLLLGMKLYAQHTYLENQWLVILSGSATYEEALTAQSTYKQETRILNSGDYDNLNPGWHITCIPFDTKQAAHAQSRSLKVAGVNGYVKYSGAYTQRPDYLLDQHFLVYAHSYLMLPHTIPKEDIDRVLGYERAGGGPFIVQASVSTSKLPAEVRYLLDKEVLVYDAKGQQQTAKIAGFRAVSLVLPHWGTLQQWEQEDLSESAQTTALWDQTQDKSLTLVAILDTDAGFEGKVAHLKGNKAFLPYTQVNEPGLEAQVYERYLQTDMAKTHAAALQESMKKDNTYAGSEHPSISQQTTTYRVGSTSYVFLQVVYGDSYAHMTDGDYYANLFGVWNASTHEFESLDDFSDEEEFTFSPLFLSNGDELILGMLMKGGSTIFRYPDWKLYRSIDVSNFDCGS